MPCSPPPSFARGSPELVRLTSWAESELRAGSVASASVCVERALQLQPRDAQAVYVKGGVQLLSGDEQRAIALFRKATRLQPSHAEAYFELGNALYGRRDYVGAEASYSSALAVEPRRALCYTNLGNVQTDQGLTERAERNFRLALGISPGGWDGCVTANGLFNLLDGDSRRSEAEAVSARVLRAVPSCHYAAYNLARTLRQQGRHAESVRLARRSVAAAPEQSEYVAGLAASLHSASLWPEAVHVYKEMLGRRGGSRVEDYRLWADLASALQRLGTPEASDRALTLLQQAVEREPGYQRGWRQLGELLHGRGEHGQVVTALETYLKQVPGSSATARAPSGHRQATAGGGLTVAKFQEIEP